MNIRQERASDEDAIRAVVTAAFDGHPHSDGSEPKIVDRLRADDDLTLSLVAEQDGEIVGHIAFSPVTIGDDDSGWHGLGPVAVRPDSQGFGIGSALVQAGLEQMRERGSPGCVLVGEPAYYNRFGFESDLSINYHGQVSEYLQSLSFTDAESPGGAVRDAPAFG